MVLPASSSAEASASIASRWRSWKTTDVRLRELLVREVGQGGPAPQRVGRPQEVRSPLPIARLDQFASLLDKGLELVRVDGLGRRIELVAGLPGGDEAPTCQWLEGLAQLRDVDLDGVGGGARRIVAPQQVDQPVGRDDFSGVQQQDREQGSLLRRPKVRGDSLGDGFEGTENPELHRCPSSTPGVRARVCGAVSPCLRVGPRPLSALYAGGDGGGTFRAADLA